MVEVQLNFLWSLLTGFVFLAVENTETGTLKMTKTDLVELDEIHGSGTGEWDFVLGLKFLNAL